MTSSYSLNRSTTFW